MSTAATRSVLQDAAWLRSDRVAAVARVLLAVFAAFVLLIPLAAPNMAVAEDFAAFWTAGRLALQGEAASAYAAPGQDAMAALLGPGAYPPFLYPPPALLMWTPFALLGFKAAAALWLAITAGLYAATIGRLAGRNAMLPALACPAVLVCCFYGQNSLLSVALLGGAAILLDRRPIVAGFLIGCLIYKPQLALLVPLAWLIAGRWRAVLAAGYTVFALIAVSALTVGWESWAGFVAALPAGSVWNADGAPGYDKYASLFAAARMLGATPAAAWIVQSAAMLGAAALVAWAARQRLDSRAEMAVLVCATALAVPFLGEYELVLLVMPAAWLIAAARRDGWLPYERATIATLFMSPLLIKTAAVQGIPLAPLAILTLTALVIRRIRPSPRPRPAPCPA